MTDNKKLMDGRDDCAVSRAQDYEIDYFVDHYLRTRGLDVSAKNRDIVRGAVRAFEPNRKVFRDELLVHLDAKWNKTKLQD